jgi:hypothetical protein
MKQPPMGPRLWGGLVAFLLLSLCLIPTAWAQGTLGSVSVTVVDASGGVLPGATLTLTDVATNDARTATTQDGGSHTFVNLNFGAHKLTVSLDGFTTQTYDVLVQAARTTDLKATLKVGAMTEVVQVSGATPLIESSTNAINTTIDMKQIEDLPLAGRNINQLSRLTAGYNGTWNGLPTFAQSNSIDGIVGNTNRWRYQTSDSAASIAVAPRIENIAEMVVSTDQMDMNQGFGSSTMSVSYVTRRGTNRFSGRLYEGYRSQLFDATNWGSTVKPKYHRNDFGASLGGPIMKDKLFFFASMAALDVPGGTSRTQNFLSDAAKQGIVTYGNGAQANLFSIFAAHNAANGTSFPASAAQINPMTAARIAAVDGYRQNGGGLAAASEQPTDRNLRAWEWQRENSNRTYYPTIRVDSNLSEKWRLNLSINQTKLDSPYSNPEFWPGDGRGAQRRSNNATASLGVQTIMSPTLINEFRGGWLYTADWFGQDGPTDYRTTPTINYGYGNYNDSWVVGNSRYQPNISVSNTTTWTKGSHTVKFGGNWYREVNKYWDSEEGYSTVALGLATGDPAGDILTREAIRAAAGAGAPLPTDAEWNQARSLYAMLAGRVNLVSGRHPIDPRTGNYAVGNTPDPGGIVVNPLYELLVSGGLFVQDSWRVKPNLTVNMGFRWDFVQPNKDQLNKYHSMRPQDVFGPTTEGQLFQPGALSGTFDPVYVTREAAHEAWNVTPQPQVGVAWTPRNDGSFVERMLGGDKSVLRGGYSFKRFTMPQQFIWDFGSSFGVGFFQSFRSEAGTTAAAGRFFPGSVVLGQGNWLPQSCATSSAPPCLTYAPARVDEVIHLTDLTFQNQSVSGMPGDIKQPYTSSWNIGIQRDLGGNRAIEVRYTGNRTRNQWLAGNINEVNIFENGFLDEFKNAQRNLAINEAAGVQNTFANRGLPGQVALPIFTATGIPFTNAGAINNLRNGAAGSLANTLATNRDFACSMFGSAIPQCGAGLAGKGYPINFWRANQFATGGASVMDDRGFSNYHGLQLEFRQRNWHGMSLNANYTLSKTNGISTQGGDFTAAYTQFTNRDFMMAYAPLITDRRHVLHVSGTYDLPFGNGRRWLQDGLLEKLAGGWTISTIVTFQSGRPFRIGGNNNTFNNIRDGGLILNGITPQDIQDRIGLYRDGAGLTYYLPPDWIAEVRASGAIASNREPGTWGQIFYLYGPQDTSTDIGISKVVNITSRVRFKLQSEILNAFNHPTFWQGTTGITNWDGTGFGRASQNATSRRIEFRANIEF